MQRHLAGFVLSIAVLVPGVAGAVQVPNAFVNENVAGGLSEPNSFAFLPDGRILVTEQHTGLIRLVIGSTVSLANPVYQVPDFNGDSYEQGLQGIAVDPAWPQRPYVYIFYNHQGNHAQISRLKATGDLDDPSGTHLTLSDPLSLIDDIPDLSVAHSGGCLRFGPDGDLYMSSGDDDDPCNAADSTTLLGAILRLRVSALEDNVTGRVTRDLITPYDNPFSTPDSNARLVWAYGFRNPWRFHIDPYTGRLYTADVGLITYEEIDEVLPGNFLGWPYREGPQVMRHPACPEPGGMGANVYKSATVNMLRDPDILVAISSAGVYRPTIGATHDWPSEYNGDYFYGEYYSGDLYRLKNVKGIWIPADSVPGQPSGGRFATGLISAVDFQVGPDGSLYYMTQYDSTLFGVSGSIQRIRFNTTPPPLAVGDLGAASIYFAGAPNPFSGRTQLAFRLPRATHVQLDLYDVGGRRLRRLMDGDGIAGENRIAWDGADAQGRALAPGVYMARLEFLGVSKTIRLVRLR